MITIEGQPSSTVLLERLAAEGKPVLLGFSRGKDSLSAWLALREYGIEVVPYHLYSIPRLAFIDDSLAFYEDFFGVKIYNLPHPGLYRFLINCLFQTPDRWAVIDAAGLTEPSYEEVADYLRQERDLPGVWNIDGVRAADSPMRRMAMATHGPVRDRTRRMSVVWDWQIADVRAILRRQQCPLPVDYQWFKRTWDGIDYRFLAPLREHAPEDYQRVLEWFPLAELEFVRRDLT